LCMAKLEPPFIKKLRNFRETHRHPQFIITHELKYFCSIDKIEQHHFEYFEVLQGHHKQNIEINYLK